MKIFLRSLPILFVILSGVVCSQNITERYDDLGEFYILKLGSAPFPHHERMDGHKYKEVTYSYLEHYNDSSVALFIPNGFDPDRTTNIVLYFHGWNNNIDKACSKFNLIEQFSQSNKNAIFIFPEGPKNSPDSFGGKLEEENGLKNLIGDVTKFLMDNEKITSPNFGNIILAGHSGAYRVISYSLKHGGFASKISDVILFDALYANSDLFTSWIKNYRGRFINIYTDNGGTKGQSEKLMDSFDTNNISYFKSEELEVSMDDLIENRIIFIHSDLGHNEVISERDQFLLFLKTSKLNSIEN